MRGPGLGTLSSSAPNCGAGWRRKRNRGRPRRAFSGVTEGSNGRRAPALTVGKFPLGTFVVPNKAGSTGAHRREAAEGRSVGQRNRWMQTRSGTSPRRSWRPCSWRDRASPCARATAGSRPSDSSAHKRTRLPIGRTGTRPTAKSAGRTTSRRFRPGSSPAGTPGRSGG